jgi:hypothetical protein
MVLFWCRNCLSKHVIEEKIERMRKQGTRRKQLLNNLRKCEDTRALKEEALDCSLWGTRFGRGYEPVVGQTR